MWHKNRIESRKLFDNFTILPYYFRSRKELRRYTFAIPNVLFFLCENSLLFLRRNLRVSGVTEVLFTLVTKLMEIARNVGNVLRLLMTKICRANSSVADTSNTRWNPSYDYVLFALNLSVSHDF